MAQVGGGNRQNPPFISRLPGWARFRMRTEPLCYPTIEQVYALHPERGGVTGWRNGAATAQIAVAGSRLTVGSALQLTGGKGLCRGADPILPG